jgi:putative nucleotidyltransferase with HDIG domain
LVEVDKVRIAQAVQRLRKNLEDQLKSRELAAQIYAWLQPNLRETLTYDPVLTQAKTDEKISQMPPEMDTYMANTGVLAKAGQVLTAEDLALLREEHRQFVLELSPQRLLYYSLSKFGMYVALYTLCGFYIFFRRRPLLRQIGSLAKLLLLVFVTIAVSWFAAPSRFELIPLLLFSMTVVILYRQELALLLSAAVALLIVLSLGHDLMDLVTLLASTSTAVLLLRHVRSRSKLIYVGLLTGGATALTAIGVGTMSHFINIANVTATSSLLLERAPALALFYDGIWLGGCAIAAGLLMTGLLPFIERFFNVQTDLSLLELGDPAHPLLQELVRRAPGTYNHSINVASIGQAAAESIGANGLLVRVGAYFHDIGKMLKPGYFVENQRGDDNCHESLLPAMSTLVIIAHVKDGADLARQHNLPDSIIDFIQQHHGTTLVEYFYRRANEQRESDPEAASVDEGSYRYPGPKPQTREAAVLMLADAVESAARTLVDPAPARIESLVDEIAMKRLLDGQFDECGLTLRELHIIQESLVKSLAAVYHGRIKYQEQTA